MRFIACDSALGDERRAKREKVACRPVAKPKDPFIAPAKKLAEMSEYSPNCPV